jgi:predicted nucleic acid-binding Zn ribbon protein
VFSTLEEAQLYRELGMAVTGDQAEIECEECSAAVTHKLARINAAG